MDSNFQFTVLSTDQLEELANILYEKINEQHTKNNATCREPFTPKHSL